MPSQIQINYSCKLILIPTYTRILREIEAKQQPERDTHTHTSMHIYIYIYIYIYRERERERERERFAVLNPIRLYYELRNRKHKEGMCLLRAYIK